MNCDIDFFSAGKALSGGARKDRITRAGQALIALSAAIVVGMLVYAAAADVALRGHIRQAQAMVGNSAAVSAAAAVSRAQRQTGALRQYAQLASQNVQAFRSLPTMDSALLRTVSAALPSGTRIAQLSYETPLLTIGCASSSATAAAEYTQKLQKTGRFSSVSCGGIDWSGSSYKFQVQALLKGGGAS